MNRTVKQLLQSTETTKKLYLWLRRLHQTRRQTKMAAAYFVNPKDFSRVFKQKGNEELRLRAKNGLLIDVRQNYMDAAILFEVLVERCYTDGLRLRANPVVIDVGGYIGDFALYACKHLNASRVITCEPSPSNLRLLRQNVTQNNYSDRVSIVPKAVTAGGDLFIDTEVPPRGQARVSAYYGTNLKPTRVEGTSLATMAVEHAISHIDLLKIDCEGGEYEILETVPEDVLAMTDNIVFEYHEIDGYKEKLNAAKERLSGNGFVLRTKGDLVFANR